MFNLYTYEKNKKLEKHKKKDLKKSSSEKKIHSLLTNKLVKRYNSRINHFILDMVKKPLKVKEYLPPMETCRKLFLEEQNYKILGPKGFVLKHYISDKERIEKLLKEKRINGEDYDYESAKKNQLKLKEKIIKQNEKKYYTIEQPKMRFKPRTDLERIVDSLNSYSYMKEYSQLVRKQLKNLEINSSKKMILKNEETYNSSTSELSSSFEEIRVKSEISLDSITQIYSQDSKKKEKKKKRTKGRILVDSDMAKQILHEYHNKTHFKAANALAEKYTKPETKKKEEFLYKKIKGLDSNNNSKENKKKYLSRSVINLNRIKNKFMNDKQIHQQINNLNQLNCFVKKFPIEENNFDIIKANPLLYSLNKKFNENQDDINLKDKLEYLKNVKLEKKEKKKKIPYYYYKKFFKNEILNKTKGASDLFKEERVWVEGKAIPISKMDEIANYVLKMCNYNKTNHNK